MLKIVNYQMSLEQAAQEIVTWSKDFYRDYENDLHKSRTERSTAIYQNYFSSLSGSVTLKAIGLVNEQWVRLADELPECICQSRKQYQLPCVHDLQPAYLEGRPPPRSLLNPRWWIAAHIPTRRGWQPEYELAIPAMTGTGRLTIQAQFHQLQDIRETLRVDLQRRFDQRIATELTTLLQEGQRLQQASTRSLQLPDNVQRLQPKIPIRDQQLVIQANREQRQLAPEVADTRVLVYRQSQSQSQSQSYLPDPALESQASIGSCTTVRPRYSSPVELSSDSEQPPPPSFSPPAPTPPPLPPSTAPPRLQDQDQDQEQGQEGRQTRKRRGSNLYRILLEDDSQEVKRARQG